VPTVDYDGLVDAMLHMLRQDGAGSAAVLIRMLDVLAAVASCEYRPRRVATLERHVALVVQDAERTIPNPRDLADLHERERRFRAALTPAPSRW
jgi:uncharacterized membrane protein